MATWVAGFFPAEFPRMVEPFQPDGTRRGRERLGCGTRHADATWRCHGKEAQHRAAGKAPGIDGTVRLKWLYVQDLLVILQIAAGGTALAVMQPTGAPGA
jgi:hypothetical protein